MKAVVYHRPRDIRVGEGTILGHEGVGVVQVLGADAGNLA